MSTRRNEFKLGFVNSQLSVFFPQKKNGIGDTSTVQVAVVEAKTPEDANCLADYLMLRVTEECQGFEPPFWDRPDQLMRGLIRRFIHTNYAGNPAVNSWPPTPEYLSADGESPADEECEP